MDLQLALTVGRMDEARRILMKRLRRSPDDVNTWLLLGWTSNTPEIARHYFDKVLQLNPGNALALDGLTYCNDWSLNLSNENIGSAKSTPVTLQATDIYSGEPAVGASATMIPIHVQIGLKTETDQVSITRTVKVGVDKIVQSAAYDRKVSLRILLVYLTLITLAEALTTLFNPVMGLVAHGLLLVALLIHGSMFAEQAGQKMLFSLALAPLIRLVSLSIPLQDYVFYFWYLLIGAPLFLSAFLVARYMGFRPHDIGLRLSGWPGQILIGLMGIGLGYIEYLILRPAPLIKTFIIEQIWLPGLILIVFTGLLEEVIFRGVMQKAFVDSLGQFRGLLFVSIVFAVLHLGYHSVFDLIFVFGVGLLFGFITLRFRSILGVTMAHGLTNFCLYLVFPFLIR